MDSTIITATAAASQLVTVGQLLRHLINQYLGQRATENSRGEFDVLAR